MDSKLEKIKDISHPSKQPVVSSQQFEPVMTAEEEVIMESLEEVWERLE